MQYNQVLSNCSTEIKHPDFNSIFFWTEKKYKIDYAENLVNNWVFWLISHFIYKKVRVQMNYAILEKLSYKYDCFL